MDFDSHRHLWILGYLLAGLLTLLGLPPYVATSSVKCPSSVDISTNVNICLKDYRAFEERHRLTGSHLFTAVDVEIVRTLCSDLKTSMRCLKSLRDRCPAVHGRIDGIIQPYMPVVELCDYQRLYEEYAMNQNCLHGQREHSDNCYRSYLAQTKLSLAGSHQRTCLYLTELASCVRTNFAQMCSDSSVQLVDLLVKAAVNDSYRCSHSHEPNRAPTITTLSQKLSRLEQHRQSNSAYPTIHCSISNSLSVITSTVLLFSRFR